MAEFSFSGKFSGGTIPNFFFFDHVVANSFECAYEFIRGARGEFQLCTNGTVIFWTVAFFAVYMKIFGNIKAYDQLNYITGFGFYFAVRSGKFRFGKARGG